MRRDKRGPASRRNFGVALSALAMLALVAAVANATYPGQNGRISFSRSDDKLNTTQIYTVNPDGTDLKQITNVAKGEAAVFSDFSPDGKLIAYDSNKVDQDGANDRVQVYIANADGTGVVQLTRGAGYHADADWSPDMSTLALEADWG